MIKKLPHPQPYLLVLTILKNQKAPVGSLMNESVYTVNLNYKDQHTKVVIEPLGVKSQVIKARFKSSRSSGIDKLRFKVLCLQLEIVKDVFCKK